MPPDMVLDGLPLFQSGRIVLVHPSYSPFLFLTYSRWSLMQECSKAIAGQTPPLSERVRTAEEEGS